MTRTDPNKPVWSPTLKSAFKSCQRWMESTGLTEFETKESGLKEALSREPPPVSIINNRLSNLGNAYSVKSCQLSAANDMDALPQALRWSVDFYALEFRGCAGIDLQAATNVVPLPFSNSLRVAAKVMLSQWRDAEICTRLLFEVAHKAFVVKPVEWLKDGWGKGTSDAFLIALLSEAFAIPAYYKPVNPLISEYQALLDVWRTMDEARFQAAMQDAITFHISRSRNSTQRESYEFEHEFYRVYPAELLAVQALRRRDGLPEFSAGHVLVDTPWSIIRDLPEVEPSPLAVQAEAVMKRAFPNFR